MKLIKNKKGMFFTLMSIMLLTIFIASLSYSMSYKERDNMFIIETRVRTINNFIDNLEQDLQRGIKISATRALIGIQDYMAQTGDFLNDSQTGFEEALVNGSVEGYGLNLTAGSSLNDWIQKIQAQAEKVNIIIDMNIADFSAEHTDPWNINISTNISFNVSDSNNIASWQFNKQISLLFNVIGFEDPIYFIKSYGKVARQIIPTNFTSWGIGNLKSHLISRTYRAYSGAPSFLMRLEGNLSSSPYGIETIVDTDEFVTYGIPIIERSSVDYIYWGSQPTTDYNIHNITDSGWSEFKLDQEHVTSYDVEAYKY